MSFGTRLGLVGAAMLLHAAPALAVVDPPATSLSDGRMRTIIYDRNNPVQIYAAPGASLRIQLGAGERVVVIVASDQGTINPGFEPAPATGVAALSGLSAAGSSDKKPSSC